LMKIEGRFEWHLCRYQNNPLVRLIFF